MIGGGLRLCEARLELDILQKADEQGLGEDQGWGLSPADREIAMGGREIGMGGREIGMGGWEIGRQGVRYPNVGNAVTFQGKMVSLWHNAIWLMRGQYGLC